MISDEKIWDKFTSLKYADMADIADRAMENVYIFQCKDFNEGFKRASENLLFTYARDYKMFATMILECYAAGDFDLDNDDEWCLLDLNADYINTGYDLLEMVSYYETEIVEGLKDDEDLLEEVMEKNS